MNEIELAKWQINVLNSALFEYERTLTKHIETLTMTTKPPLIELVHRIVVDEGPCDTTQVVEWLMAKYHIRVNRGSVSTYLGNLVRSQRLVRVSPGVYDKPRS